MKDTPVRPRTDSEAVIEAMGHAIAELSAHITAATCRLLRLIANFDERCGWSDGDFHSCAHWLSWRVGIDLATAREKVRTARALVTLPAIDESFAAGEISYSKVRAVTRIARPETEDDLLVMAKAATAAQMERFVRAYRHADPEAEKTLVERQRLGRRLRTYTDFEGMLVIDGRLEPEAGARFLAVLDAGFQTLNESPAENASAETPRDTPGARRADALARVAEAALGEGFSQRKAAPAEVVVHIDAEVLADPAKDGRCALNDGPAISPHIARKLGCDAILRTVAHDKHGEAIDLGRRRRTVSPALRRALLERDEGCAHPCCDNRLFLHAHHIEHWADGGETKIDNLIMLCSSCHSAVHDGRVTLQSNAEGPPRFVNAFGKAITPAPIPPAALPLEALHDAQQLHIDSETMPCWNGDTFDYDWGLEILHHRVSRKAAPS